MSTSSVLDMSKQYWPTGPAECKYSAQNCIKTFVTLSSPFFAALRTREFAEAEWSRLATSAARDKNSFLSELKDINDRIIGLKQALPPLNIPQTVSYQEKPKDYGFVVDSNMRVASATSLNNAKGLRENLSRMLAQQTPQSAPYNPGEPGLSRHETKRTDFDILSSAKQAEKETRSSGGYLRQEPSLRPVDGYFVPSAEHRYESEDARKDAEFARALDAYRSSRPSTEPEETQLTSEKHSTSLSPVLEEPVSLKTDNLEEREVDDEVADEEGSEDEGQDTDDEEEKEEEEEPESENKAVTCAPAVPISSAPKEFVPAPSTPAPVLVARQPIVTPPTSCAPTPAASQPASSVPAMQNPPSMSVPATVPSKPVTDESRPAPATTPATEPTQDSNSDQLSRLQAWEKELQEREQKVLQYMSSLSRPIGAKMAPKPLPDDSEPEQDIFEQRYGSRRREEAQSALRGSADIHIHNHIAPPITMPAYAPQPAPVPRASLYDSYRRSTFTPSKYEYTPAQEVPRDFVTPNVQPSIQTRYPQRSEIRSNYAFPPAPYSSLNSNASNVDLSGLSLERMRELTGHY